MAGFYDQEWVIDLDAFFGCKSISLADPEIFEKL